MPGYKGLKSLLKTIVAWEKKLTDFYDVAEYALEKEISKVTVRILRDNHTSNVRILQDIRVEDFGKDEWIQYVPDYNVRDLLPIDKITRDSTPHEIIYSILEYEEKIMGLYSRIAEKTVKTEERELFDSLVVFKNAQIVRIKQLLEFL